MSNALAPHAGTSASIRTAIAPVIGPLRELAEFYAGFERLPKGMSVSDAMIAACAGARFGLDPMTSLTAFHVVEGKPTMAADAMAGFILSHPMCAEWRWVESTATEARLRVQRNDGSEPIEFGYTIAEAKSAGLASKHNWKNHPAAMLRARATTVAGRAVFPDVIFGIYSGEEMADAGVLDDDAVEVPFTEHRVQPVDEPVAKPVKRTALDWVRLVAPDTTAAYLDIVAKTTGTSDPIDACEMLVDQTGEGDAVEHAQRIAERIAGAAGLPRLDTSDPEVRRAVALLAGIEWLKAADASE